MSGNSTSNSNAFSSSLQLAGLDYLPPSAVCVKPTILEHRRQQQQQQQKEQKVPPRAGGRGGGGNNQLTSAENEEKEAESTDAVLVVAGGGGGRSRRRGRADACAVDTDLMVAEGQEQQHEQQQTITRFRDAAAAIDPDGGGGLRLHTSPSAKTASGKTTAALFSDDGVDPISNTAATAAALHPDSGLGLLSHTVSVSTTTINANNIPHNAPAGGLAPSLPANFTVGSGGGGPVSVKISLQDCLACSGCVTTAETVLVEAQGRARILAARREQQLQQQIQEHQQSIPAPAAPLLPPWLVTVSDASAAAIAAQANISFTEALSLISGFVRHVLTAPITEEETLTETALRAANGNKNTITTTSDNNNNKNTNNSSGKDENKKESEAEATNSASSSCAVANNGPIYVTDLQWANTIAKAQTAAEYVRRVELHCQRTRDDIDNSKRDGAATQKQQQQQKQKPSSDGSNEQPIMTSAEVTVTHTKGGQEKSASAVDDDGALPMLVSACPGWVCYCEKQGSALLPHVCRVMSAQGIAGSYAKHTIDERLFHVSVQPCFDRKLEAARDRFRPLPAGVDTSVFFADGRATTAFAATAATGAGSGAAATTHFHHQPSADTRGDVDNIEKKTTTGATQEEEEEVEEGKFYTDCVLSTVELFQWMMETDPSLPWRAALDAPTAAFTTTTPVLSSSPLPPPFSSSSSPAAAPSSCSNTLAEWSRFEGSGGFHLAAMRASLRHKRRRQELPTESKTEGGGGTATSSAAAADCDECDNAVVVGGGDKSPKGDGDQPLFFTIYDEEAALAGYGRDRPQSSHFSYERIQYEVKRNRNHQLATFSKDDADHGDGDSAAREVFCVAYGFQQIQNVVRGLKKNLPATRGYTFVELMACPGGCLNGGGQCRPGAYPPATTSNGNTTTTTSSPAAVSIGSSLSPIAAAEALSRQVADVYAQHRRDLGGQTASQSKCNENITSTSAVTTANDVRVGDGGNRHDLTQNTSRDTVGVNTTTTTPFHTNNSADTANAGGGGGGGNKGSSGGEPAMTEEEEEEETRRFPLFNHARIRRALAVCGETLWTCVLHDRQKEFEQILSEGNVHSLKW